tara:strand:+ start:10123 stop:11259 length:1137 start_codon:yes stop_codon:yes gene_type:complete
MSKFNLVNYIKNNGDEHIDHRLREEHQPAPESVTEKQLERDRTGEKEQTMEALLEKVRQGSADSIIEKNLNDAKGGFHTHRDKSTYDGDMNKVEEQRLAGDRMEDEKYEAASSTPKTKRWWDKLKATAEDDKSIKKSAAELDFSKPHFEETGYAHDDDGEVSIDEGSMSNFDIVDDSDDFSSNDDDDESMTGNMFVKKNKVLTEPFGSIYMSFGYDPSDYNSDEDLIREDALLKAIELRPNLADKIDVNIFSTPEESDGSGEIKLRLIGDEYIEEDQPLTVNDKITEAGFEKTDSGGTPMYMGLLKVPDDITVEDVVSYVNDTHPEVNITPDAVDMSDVDSGEVAYIASGFEIEGVSDLDDLAASSNFDITVVSQKKN